MDLSSPIDPGEQEILVVELEIEPRSPIRDDATGVDLLACRADRRRDRRVVEDAGRAMQLGDDDALRSVDDEGSLLRHHGDFPEIDLLLLHIADRLRSPAVVPGDESNRHLERSRIGHSAREAILHVVFRLLEGVTHELERRGVIEILDRKDRVEHRLQADVLALFHLHMGL